MSETSPRARAMLVGATGLIGNFCLKALLADNHYTEVTAVSRRPLVVSHKKLKTVITNFRNIEQDLANTRVDDVFCCLGTTIKKAGSQAAFQRIDLELVTTIAALMKTQGARQFIVVSSLGANVHSRVFYSRIKGEMEAALEGLHYPCLRIVRPSLLLGPRKELLLAERIGGLLAPLASLLLQGNLRRYRPIAAECVARFMVQVAKQEPVTGFHVYESEDIRSGCNSG